MTAVGMVGVGVGDEGSVYGFPGVDVEVACGAVESFGADGDEGGHESDEFRYYQYYGGD